MGRANWLFADTITGANVNAIMYSIVETAKANRADVRLYLQYLLEKTAEAIDAGNADAKAEKSEAKAENKSDDEQIQSYWFMNKTLSSRGGNWGASYVTLSDPDDNGLPTTVTVTDSGFDVMGNPLDGVFPITIDQYDPYDEMDYLIGRYVGNPGAGIKGEFFDENGKGLTLQVD